MYPKEANETYLDNQEEYLEILNNKKIEKPVKNKKNKKEKNDGDSNLLIENENELKEYLEVEFPTNKKEKNSDINKFGCFINFFFSLGV